MADWQPIATAPKDGAGVLLYHPGFKGAFYERDKQPRWWVDHWTSRGWWQAAPSAMPTHWQPLPPAPGVAGVDGETFSGQPPMTESKAND